MHTVVVGKRFLSRRVIHGCGYQRSWHAGDISRGKVKVEVKVRGRKAFRTLLGKSKSKLRFGVLPLLYASDVYIVNKINTR